jgi:hypothetical protein
MERRDFVAVVGGLVVVAALGAVAGPRAVRMLAGDEGQGDWAFPAERDGLADAVFVTPDGVAPELAAGPVMVAGLELLAAADDGPGAFKGYCGETHLFNVDALGASLIRLADGSRTIEQIALMAPAEAAALAASSGAIAFVASSGAAELATSSGAAELAASDTAAFFVQLGQAGYLQNQVYVALFENRA